MKAEQKKKDYMTCLEHVQSDYTEEYTDFLKNTGKESSEESASEFLDMVEEDVVLAEANKTSLNEQS